jgi:hypothetical protein
VLRAAQVVFVVAMLWFAGWFLAEHWLELRAVGSTLTPSWWRILGSAGIVLASYAVLIATWRAMVTAWGARIAPGPAARIWFVSNLGRYVPGKIWQVTAMGAMAHRAGVPPMVAAGSAIVISLVNVVVGFAIVGVTGAPLVASVIPGAGVVPVIIALAAMAALLVALPWLLPGMTRLGFRILRREPPANPTTLPPRAIWVAALGCGVAWVLYGVAFRELATGVLGSASGDASAYVAVFTLSYLLGFLALFAAGGIGVREVSMATLLIAAGLAGRPEAAVLVIVSRLWLTVLEVVPGVVLLAWRGGAREPEGPRGASRVAQHKP